MEAKRELEIRNMKPTKVQISVKKLEEIGIEGYIEMLQDRAIKLEKFCNKHGVILKGLYSLESTNNLDFMNATFKLGKDRVCIYVHWDDFDEKMNQLDRTIYDYGKSLVKEFETTEFEDIDSNENIEHCPF